MNITVIDNVTKLPLADSFDCQVDVEIPPYAYGHPVLKRVYTEAAAQLMFLTRFINRGNDENFRDKDWGLDIKYTDIQYPERN
jgi:hypothetical protein